MPLFNATHSDSQYKLIDVATVNAFTSQFNYQCTRRCISGLFACSRGDLCAERDHGNIAFNVRTSMLMILSCNITKRDSNLIAAPPFEIIRTNNEILRCKHTRQKTDGKRNIMKT